MLESPSILRLGIGIMNMLGGNSALSLILSGKRKQDLSLLLPSPVLSIRNLVQRLYLSSVSILSFSILFLER